eukprot:TRINITY_DN4212_c0_g1_i2.p1 TRINITY_DN4212_c0_g1~~TRINITY_DN4212_c0_g1_i2.p1  ORF type:complete len:157 (+),score=23.44 TRINITY_DN4212_c0_g1_i2:617-1087(+)
MIVQLFFASTPGSIISSLCGIVAGYMYRFDTLGLENLVLPSFLCNIGEKFAPLLGTGSKVHISTMNRNRQTNPAAQQQVQFQPQFQNQPQFQPQFQQVQIPAQPQVQQRAGNLPARRQPSPQNVQALMNMGFSMAEANQALTITNDDVQGAVSMLI